MTVLFSPDVLGFTLAGRKYPFSLPVGKSWPSMEQGFYCRWPGTVPIRTPLWFWKGRRKSGRLYAMTCRIELTLLYLRFQKGLCLGITPPTLENRRQGQDMDRFRNTCGASHSVPTLIFPCSTDELCAVYRIPVQQKRMARDGLSSRGKRHKRGNEP